MAAQLDVGSWGLFCGREGRQLVLVDDTPCGPVSARKVARSLPRRLLLDESRVLRTMERGEDLSEQLVHGEGTWIVRVNLLRSPKSGSIIGALAGVFAAGEKIPPPPLVGMWEWEIERDEDGNPTPRRRTYWDKTLFEIYDMDPEVTADHPGYWEAGQWASDLIDQADRMRLNTLIRDGIQDGLNGVTDVFRCLTYNIVTGYGAVEQDLRHLRLVGRVVPVSPDDPTIVLQGFSYDVPDSFHDMAFEQDANAGRVDDVLRGAMVLTRDPMAVVDVETLDVLMTSASWRREDFGHIGGLGEFVDDDFDGLQAFIAAAARDRSASKSTSGRLRRVDGSTQKVRLTAIGVQGQDVVIRLDL